MIIKLQFHASRSAIKIAKNAFGKFVYCTGMRLVTIATHHCRSTPCSGCQETTKVSLVNTFFCFKMVTDDRRTFTLMPSYCLRTERRIFFVKVFTNLSLDWLMDHIWHFAVERRFLCRQRIIRKVIRNRCNSVLIGSVSSGMGRFLRPNLDFWFIEISN
jgi:hypothetical protein